MTVRWTVRAATGLASASCHANSVTEGLLRGALHRKNTDSHVAYGMTWISELNVIGIGERLCDCA